MTVSYLAYLATMLLTIVLIFGGTGYVVFALDRGGEWFVGAVIVFLIVVDRIPKPVFVYRGEDDDAP